MEKYFFNRYYLLTRTLERAFLYGIVILSLSSLVFTACARQKEQGKEPAQMSSQSAAQESELSKGTADLSTAIEQVARQAIPAMAHIEVTKRQEVSTPLLPFENNPFFRRFFGVPEAPRKFKRELKGLGTGMIMDSQGHILTNNHVVGGATEIEVLLASGERYPATVVGTDPKTDLAVIQISAKQGLAHVTFGDSDKVEVGQWVVAIGHPRGLDQTVTQGIISAKHRAGIMDPSTYQDYLQTDAAINPGNSGGPLLNLQGEVIGVNAAISSQSGGFEGIGFAIPCNMALYIAGQLIDHGKVERGWLGVSIQDLTPQLAEKFGVEREKGALVAEVMKSGPAEKAGMKRGDIVVAYGGKDIANASALRNEVATNPIGEQVKLTVLREGKKVELAVTIGKLEDMAKLLSASVKERLGAELKTVATPEEAQKYGLSSPQVVEIAWLNPKGPLGQVGFEVGDVLLEINHRPIEDFEGFVGLVSALQPHQKIVVLALDHRSGNTGYVEVEVR